MLNANGTRIPHSLRLAAFFLRLAVGVSFFYLGFSTLFNTALAEKLRPESMSGLYDWLASPSGSAWLHPAAQWAFLIIGISLILGFATRLASLIGIALTALAYLPGINFASLSVSQIVNDEAIILFCLIIISLSRAGTYLGLDRFMHFSLRHKKQ